MFSKIHHIPGRGHGAEALEGRGAGGHSGLAEEASGGREGIDRGDRDRGAEQHATEHGDGQRYGEAGAGLYSKVRTRFPPRARRRLVRWFYMGKMRSGTKFSLNAVRARAFFDLFSLFSESGTPENSREIPPCEVPEAFLYAGLMPRRGRRSAFLVPTHAQARTCEIFGGGKPAGLGPHKPVNGQRKNGR